MPLRYRTGEFYRKTAIVHASSGENSYPENKENSLLKFLGICAIPSIRMTLSKERMISKEICQGNADFHARFKA